MNQPFHGTMAGAIEIAINRVLSLDPSYNEKLQGIAGNVIEISITDWQMSLFFLPDQYQFTILSTFEGIPIVKLSGSSWNFFRIGINQTSTSVINSSIHFEGDIATGQKFAQLFSGLSIDWEEALADKTGDIFAHQAVNAVRSTGKWLKQAFNSSRENMGEYLQEELRLTPTRIEIENFYDDLENLITASEQLLNRAQCIEKLDAKTLHLTGDC